MVTDDDGNVNGEGRWRRVDKGALSALAGGDTVDSGYVILMAVRGGGS